MNKYVIISLLFILHCTSPNPAKTTAQTDSTTTSTTTNILAVQAPIRSIETSIPAFVGYTQQASLQGESLIHKPQFVNSYTEYQQSYGGDTTGYHLSKSVYLFFQNGGGKCCIISVGLTTQATG